VLPGEVLVTVHASDPDTQLVCHQSTGGGETMSGGGAGLSSGSCDCARVIYAIASGDEESQFAINSKTGAISLVGTRPVDTREKMLYMMAVNEEVEGIGGDLVGPKSYSKVNVVLGGAAKSERDRSDSALSGGEYYGEEGRHSRHKRVSTLLRLF